MTINSVNLTQPTDYTVEAQKIERQRKLAEALQQQAFQPTEGQNVPGGWYVPASATQHLAKVLAGYNSRKQQESADTQQNDLAKRFQADQGADAQMLVKALQGRQAQTIQPDPQEAQQAADYGTPQVGAVSQPAMSPTESLQAALPEMRTPMGQQLASTYLMKQLSPDEKFGHDPKIEKGPDGNPIAVLYGDKGTRKVIGPVNPRDEVVADNLGGSTTYRTKFDTKPLGTAEHSMSPDAVANLNWKKFEFANLSASQTEHVKTELARLNISEKQLAEGRVQLLQDGDGNVMVVNKLTGVGANAMGPDGKPLQGNQKPTEAQMKAAVFHSQMASATDELAKIPGYDATKGLTQAETAVAGGRGNMLVPEAAQRAKQAQSQWAEAFLRFKTGAASTPAEVAMNVSTFFPQIGDAPATVEQKSRMRAQAERDMAMAAGRKIPNAVPKTESPAVPGSPLKVVKWKDLG